MTTLEAPQLPVWLPPLYAVAPAHARRLTLRRLLQDAARDNVVRQRDVARVLAALGLHSPLLVEQIVTLPQQFIADVMLLRHAPEYRLRRLDLAVHDTSGLSQRRQGVVLAALNFGCFYLGLLRLPPTIDEVLVITPNVPPPEERLLCERIARIAGVGIRLAEASSRSAVTIARTLKRGGVVATMLDSHIPGTPSFRIPLFGRPAATPRGIYEIIARQDVLIVPAYNLRRGSGFDIHFDAPTATAGRSAEALAGEVNARFEALIRQHPAQWLLWPTLPERWNALPAAAEADARRRAVAA